MVLCGIPLSNRNMRLLSYVAHFIQTLVQSWEGHKPPAETGQAFPYIHVNDKQNKKSIMLMSGLDM